MLYDILFIDDDFSEDKITKADMLDVRTLFFELVRSNLRVTYTTGELDDLKKLCNKDLSCIKYIFCDLHLTGIQAGENKFKDIGSKLAGIFDTLNKYIQSDLVTVFINSNYIQDWKEVKKILKIDKRYQFKINTKKNKLSEKNKKQLLQDNLELHSKSLIINKAVEVERIFDKKLSLSSSTCQKLDFSHKYLVFQSQHDVENGVKKQIQLLQQIRNKLAHADNDLQGIQDDNLKETFWGIISNVRKKDKIEFKEFGFLAEYLTHIEELKNAIEKTPKKDSA
ncbi:hypothetical protein SPBRAN_1248 [uncultured Candidatus Thioglobus sp.]|nr:hypothetical protein SPBRAN_1248 [uncultured Candidatus Thioglobus sp.]